MAKISTAFKPFADEWLENLKSITDKDQEIGTVRADAALIGDQASEVRSGDHRLISDEPRAIGGSDTGPSPLDYFMAAIGFCENVTFARYATLYGLEFESLSASVRGHWDRRGQLESSTVEPAFLDFTVETRLRSNEAVEKIKRVAKISHRRCPMHATIARAGRVLDKLYVNGEEVPL